MISGAYDAFEDPYLYPGSSVLRNLLDIRDQETLETYEVEISTLRSEEPLPAGDFDPSHYRRVHRHLFGDVYSWAGQYRSVSTSKGGNVFCHPAYIDEQMNALFTIARGVEGFFPLAQRDFVIRAADFLGELNAIHPFREGNGRTQLVFLGLIGNACGHTLDFKRLRRETFLPAMVTSFSRDIHLLENELSALLG